MSAVVAIEDLKDHAGEVVTVQGWLYHKTGKGKLQFLQVRDGTGICQTVVFRPNVGDEAFAEVKELTQESSLKVTGLVKANHAGRTGRLRDRRAVRGDGAGCGCISDYAEGARHRVPNAEPASVATLVTPVGGDARTCHGGAGDPRLVG